MIVKAQMIRRKVCWRALPSASDLWTSRRVCNWWADGRHKIRDKLHVAAKEEKKKRVEKSPDDGVVSEWSPRSVFRGNDYGVHTLRSKKS